MPNFRLISAFLRGAWLIDPIYSEGMLPLVVRYLNGEPVTFFEKKAYADDQEDSEPVAKILPIAVSLHNGLVSKHGSTYDNAPSGSIAVIPVKGVVMKEDNCGDPGTSTIQKWVKEADQHPNIIGTILHLDGPGGQVDGTFELADVIKASTKPVVSFVDGSAYSATYAIASAGNEIIMSHKAAGVGSIGTMITLYDNTEALKRWGYKKHDIRADDSKDKNEAYYKALEGNYEKIKSEILNPTNDVFHATVKHNRDGKLNVNKDNEPLTGKTYLAEEAISFGLADSIGTFEDAVARATELGTVQQSATNTNHTSMKRKIQSGLGALISFLKFTVNGSETNEEMTDAHLESVNTELARLQAVEAEYTTLKGEVDTLKSQLSTTTTERDSLKTEVETLKKQPGAAHTSPQKEGTEGGGSATSYIDMNADHNKLAQQIWRK